MSAKKKDAMKTFGLLLPFEMFRKFKILAAQRDIHMGKLICQALIEWWEWKILPEKGEPLITQTNGNPTETPPEVLDGN